VLGFDERVVDKEIRILRLLLIYEKIFVVLAKLELEPFLLRHWAHGN